MPTPVDVSSRPVSVIAELESFLEQNPGNAAAHFRLGQVYQEHHDRPKALRHLAEAVRLSPEDLNFRKLLADFQYVEMGDLESAITHYVAILDRDPKNVENLTILGNIALSMSRFVEARKFFSAIARLEPWNGEVRTILEAIARKLAVEQSVPAYQTARELAESGRSAEAIRALEQIIAAEPRHTRAHNDLGVLYASQGDVPRALEHALVAVQAEPGDIVARKNLGDLYQALLHRPEDAMHQYLEVLRRAPDDIETLLSVGSLCITLGRGDDARGFFEMVLRHQPGHLQAQELLARLGPGRSPEPAASDTVDSLDGFSDLFGDPKIERILKEKEQYAREYLNGVLRQEPGNRSARRGLEGLEAGGNGSGTTVESRYAEATRLASGGRRDDALQILEGILRQDPSFAPAHNDIAVLAGSDGNIAEAQRHYEQAVSFAPDNLVFRKNLGDFHFAVTGNAEAALEQYVRVLEKAPRDIDTLLCIGQVCEQLRRNGDAAMFYTTALTLDPANLFAQEAVRRMGPTAEDSPGPHVPMS